MALLSDDAEQTDTQAAQQLTQERNYRAMTAPAANSSGKIMVNWYLSLFSALSTLGTLGAGFTLSVVVQSSTSSSTTTSSSSFSSGHHDSTTSPFPPSLVKNYAATSSILFVLTVLVCQGCSQVFKFEQSCIAEGIDEEERLVRWPLAALSLLLQLQVLGAFLCLELVITAHAPRAGWIGVGCTAFLGVVVVVLWVLQEAGREPVARIRGLGSNRRRRLKD